MHELKRLLFLLDLLHFGIQIPAWEKRLRSVDILRGVAVIGAILITNQADAATSSPLFQGTYTGWALLGVSASSLLAMQTSSESAWNGLNAADFVAPLFLFLA